MSDEKTKSGYYPVTPEIVKVLTDALANGRDKNLLAASIGVTVSCLDQWLRGDTKQIRADNYVALCVQHWIPLGEFCWADPMPEFTAKRYSKTMDQLHEEFEKDEEKFLMALRPAKQRESKSNGVSFVCVECGKALATKVMTKSGSFVVGVERCQTCAGEEIRLSQEVKKVASFLGESYKDMQQMAKKLEAMADELWQLATAIEKPGKEESTCPEGMQGKTA